MHPISRSMLAAVTFVVGLIVGWFGKSAISVPHRQVEAPAPVAAADPKPKTTPSQETSGKEAAAKAQWESAKHFGTRLMFDTTLEDGPTFAYYDFVSKTDGLPSDKLVELLNQFYAASNDEKSGAVEEAVVAGIGCLIMRLSSTDPKAAATWLMTNMPDADDESMITQAWSTIATKDPALMKSLIAGATDEDLRTRLDLYRLVSMAKTQPDAAISEIFSTITKRGRVGPSPEYLEAAGKIVSSLTEKEPARAAEIAIKIAAAGQSSDLKEVMQNWSKKDPEGSMRWALSLSGDAATRACEARLSADASPEEIKQVAAAMQKWTNATPLQPTNPDEESDVNPHAHSLLRMVLDNLVAEKGVSAAQEWMAGFADPKLKVAAESELISSWIDTDPVAASSHIAEMADSPEKNQAITKLVDQIVSTDPERAFAWARKISDDEKQQFQMESSMKAWLESDPISAANTLEQMPPAFRERILRKSAVE